MIYLWEIKLNCLIFVAKVFVYNLEKNMKLWKMIMNSLIKNNKMRSLNLERQLMRLKIYFVQMWILNSSKAYTRREKSSNIRELNFETKPIKFNLKM